MAESFRDLFRQGLLTDLDHEEEEEQQPAGPDRRCTPELLLAFVQEHLAATGKHPTLRDIKQRFGGIIGPLIDGWTLKQQGRWPGRRKLK